METRVGQSVAEAAAWLQQGRLVAIPTETVYGLAANALDADAVLDIFAVKGRPAFNPLIVHVHDATEFARYAETVPDEVYQLAARFSPGPITFVLPRKACIPDAITAGGDTVALRIPNHPLTLELLRSTGMPLAAPSANPSGYISPVTANHVLDQLGGRIPYILDGGPCSVGIESTVVTWHEGRCLVLRTGGLTIEELRSVVPTVETTSDDPAQPRSPGQLTSHYAPRIPLVLGNLDELLERHAGQRIGLLSFRPLAVPIAVVRHEVLSTTGDLGEAARSLFGALRRLDACGADIILAERVPEHGLGVAINDRLQRAAAER